jgi:hypothetical protein
LCALRRLQRDGYGTACGTIRTAPLRPVRCAAQREETENLCVVFVRQIVDPARGLLFKQQFAGATGRFDDRLDKGNAEFTFFEFEDSVDSAACGGSDRVL